MELENHWQKYTGKMNTTSGEIDLDTYCGALGVIFKNREWTFKWGQQLSDDAEKIIRLTELYLFDKDADVLTSITVEDVIRYLEKQDPAPETDKPCFSIKTMSLYEKALDSPIFRFEDYVKRGMTRALNLITLQKRLSKLKPISVSQSAHEPGKY